MTESKLQISQRGIEMPESPIRKLAPLAYAAQERGVKIYRLNIGQPDLPTPQKALDVLKHVDRTTLEYSPSQGYKSLRQALVHYYERYQIKLNCDEIIITAGGSEAVLFAFMSCLNPGDEIIVPEPAYANYMSFAISAGAVIRTVTTTIDEGFCLPKVEKFEELKHQDITFLIDEDRENEILENTDEYYYSSNGDGTSSYELCTRVQTSKENA